MKIFLLIVLLSIPLLNTADNQNITTAKLINQTKNKPYYKNMIFVISKYEKYQEKPYKLFGKWFVGYGHLTTDSVTTVCKSTATDLLKNDLQTSINYVKHYYNADNKTVHKIALLVYNCGIGTVLKTNIIQLAKNQSCIDEAFLSFNKINDKYHEKLQQRRINELNIF